MPLLKYHLWHSSVDATFWHSFAEHKLNVLKLSEAPLPVRCAMSPVAAAPGRVVVTADSLDPERPPPAHHVAVPGTMINYNTLDDFRGADKPRVLREHTVDPIWEDICSGRALRDPACLWRVLVLAHADLKKHHFFYWFAFPALLDGNEPTVERAAQPLASKYSEAQLASLHDAVMASGLPVLVVEHTKGADAVRATALADWDGKVGPSDGDTTVQVVVIDAVTQPDHPGWGLRNVLLLLRVHFGLTRVEVIAYRDLRAGTGAGAVGSLLLDVTMPASSRSASIKAVGWEKNARGKAGPQMMDLGALMDPGHLAETAVDLNLKLMRWRLLPTLDTERVSRQSCLLLGSGTLGCNVARALLAWGVRRITMCDQSKVSYSNPVRQSLFHFQDCVEGGQHKAEAAARELKAVFPGVDARAEDLSIPMPGHPIADADMAKAEAQVARLDKLIAEHDATFLLTDTRESRWLPTLLAARHGKLLINTALGFDSYVVMRHGVPRADGGKRLGCYFCNDVVAPSDSLQDRTLDQQCTVTRPGLAMMAGALAVELMVALLHHSEGTAAAADVDPHAEPDSCLGLVPHQIRGFVATHQTMMLAGQHFDACTACSAKVVDAYTRDGFAFVRSACASPTFLEDLTGLTELHARTKEVVDVEWDDEGDGDDF